MNTPSCCTNPFDISFFADAENKFKAMAEHLSRDAIATEEHGSIEQYIDKEGNELLRLMLQAALDRIAENEVRLPHVINSNGDQLSHVRKATSRKLTSLFGPVSVRRMGYSLPNKGSEFPADARLNLCEDQYSDGLHKQIVNNAVHLSYDNTLEKNQETCAGHVPKRQAMQIAANAAQDFESFYQQREVAVEETNDLLVLTFDGKGIVMLPDSLREETRKRAAESKNKLQTRLSTGEKKDRKRMSEVAAVYTTLPDPRTAESIMNLDKDQSNVHKLRAPSRNKRVWASVERTQEQVISEAFEEALKRDPEQKRQWVVVVDGERHQLNLIEKVMEQKQVKATVMLDFIHVLEYLWKASRCFFKKDDPKVETWIAEQAVNILRGEACDVARYIQQCATERELKPKKRKAVDKCAVYLTNNKQRLRYDMALEEGFPIASGVIEGACRHLINDRIDITGARWSLKGVEAILKLRALNSSGDRKAYWAYHRECSKQRNYKHLLTIESS